MPGPPGDLDLILAARRHVRVAHHVPGRLRLRFEPLGLAGLLRGRGDALQDALRRVRGIQGTEVNLAACSLLVQYDPALLPSAHWDRLLTGSAASAAALLADLLTTPA